MEPYIQNKYYGQNTKKRKDEPNFFFFETKMNQKLKTETFKIGSNKEFRRQLMTEQNNKTTINILQKLTPTINTKII